MMQEIYSTYEEEDGFFIAIFALACLKDIFLLDWSTLAALNNLNSI